MLSTTGDPKGDTACDWAGWENLRFGATSAKGAPGRAENPFRLAFHDAVDAYEYPFSLPRASVFSRAMVVPFSGTSARGAPETRKFDPWRQVVLEAPSADAVTVPQQPAEIAKPARIESYDTEHVVVQAETDEPGWLLLTDSNYPGWKAYVDGQPAPILKANFLSGGCGYFGALIGSSSATLPPVRRPLRHQLVFRDISRRMDLSRPPEKDNTTTKGASC